MARILVVDDSEMVRVGITTMLETGGHDVRPCSTGHRAAQELFEVGGRYDLVITDLHMPLVTGLELLERIRSNPDTQDLPVLVVSAETDRSLLLAARRTGATGWICKPINRKALLKAINTMLPPNVGV